MAAVGFAMLTVGALLIYAGMAGESLPGAIQGVVKGTGPAPRTGTGAPARVGGGDWNTVGGGDWNTGPKR